MKTYIISIWDSIRSSYWFVPSLFAVGAVLLSMNMPDVDSLVSDTWELPEWVLTTTDTARMTLSAILGGMFAITGTVFSITIVTLSLTSQQFGPRLLRGFMHDLMTQVTLGVFLATGAYSLLLLHVVEHHEGGSTPHLSVTVAVLLAVASLVVLIAFFHNVAMMIQAPNIVASVAEELNEAIENLFPEEIGQGKEREKKETAAILHEEEKLGKPDLVISSESEGYIQAINEDGIVQFAVEHDLVLRLQSRPGDFIGIQSRIAEIWFNSATKKEKGDLDKLKDALNDMIITGRRRTPRQDINCAIEELAEVAVRSLSPGINDPFTAINCIDRLGASLGRLAERKLPEKFRFDEDDRLRIIARPILFEDTLGASFNQIRQYGRRSVAVTLRLLETLISIGKHVRRDEDRIAIRNHGEMILRGGESFEEENDVKKIRDQFAELHYTLNSGFDSQTVETN